MALAEQQKHGSRGALFETQASAYAAFRPRYPPELYERIFAFAAGGGSSSASSNAGPGGCAESPAAARLPEESPRRQLAVDVATGSGQVAVELSGHYQRVVALDSSAAQLASAERRPNVEYVEAAAEQLGEHVAPGSADLITVAQAFHWFDHATFYEAAARALRPGSGTLAIWGYTKNHLLPLGVVAAQQQEPQGKQKQQEGEEEEEEQQQEMVEGEQEEDQQQEEGQPDAAAVAEASRLVDEWCFGPTGMGPYWDPGRAILDACYAGLEPSPSCWRAVERVELTMQQVMSLNHLMGYLSTFSPYISYRKRHPDRPDTLPALRAQLEELLQPADSSAPVVAVTWPVPLLLARGPLPPPPAAEG